MFKLLFTLSLLFYWGVEASFKIFVDQEEKCFYLKPNAGDVFGITYELFPGPSGESADSVDLIVCILFLIFIDNRRNAP